MTKVSFYCKKCGLDQDLGAVIATFCGGGKKFIAKCRKCGDELFRLIDEREKDPYYYLSKNVIINRRKFAKDILQPGQDGFKLYYKKEWDKMEKAKEEFEKKQIEDKKRRDEFYKSFVDKGLAKKILEKEEIWNK